MLEVTVKTLDSQNRSFSVPDDSTVKEFKQQIAPILGIEADKQRLIFCGRVLQDDKKLNEYNVDGKVIHLVQRPPPQAQVPRTNAATNGTSATNSTTGTRTDRDGSSFLLGAFGIPRDVFDPNHVQNIVQDVVSGMGEWGRNATVMSRTSEDGSSVDVHINLGVTPLQSEAQSRLNQVQSMLARASSLIQLLDTVNGRQGNSESNSTPGASLDIEIEEQNSATPSASAQPLVDMPMFAQFFERTSGEGLSFLQTSEGSTSGTPSAPSVSSAAERPGIGEGIAQAARAAVAAAVAAAAGAAAAAVRVTSANNTQSSDAPQSDQSAATTEETTPQAPAATQADDDELPDLLPPDAPEVPVSETTTGTNGTSATSSSGTGNRQGPQRPVQPSVNALLPLWEEITTLNNRLQPHMRRCTEQIRSETTLGPGEIREAQMIFDWVSKILHFLSHAYHNLSDLYVNFNQPTPRTLRVRIIASSPPTTFMHGAPVPFQAQVNISSSNSINMPEDLITATSTRTLTSTTFTTDASTRTTAETTSTTSTRTTPSFSSGPSMPLMFNSSPSPFVFMEVSPSAITIDSISATLVDSHRTSVVTTAPSSVLPVSTTNSSSSRAASAERQQPATTESQSSEGPRLIGYGTLPPFVSSASGSLPPLRGFNAMNFPLGNFPSMRSSFDPNLPCNSIWAHEGSMRRRHNAGTGGVAAAQPPSTAPVSTSSSTRQGDILHNVISGLVNTVLTEATTVSGSRPITATASIPGFAVFAASASPEEGASILTPRLDQNFFRSALNSEARNSGQGNASSQNSSSQNNEPSPFSDEVFMSLIQGLQLSMNDQERVTVAEFLTRLDEDGYVEGQSILSDLFMCIGRETTFPDLAAVFFGQTAPLTRMRSALQQFVRERVLKNSEPTEENINRAADEVILDSKSLVDFILAEGNIRNDVDYAASFNKFTRLNVNKLINSILNPPEGETFGASIFRAYRQVLSEFIALNVFCFSDGSDSLERLTQMRINALTHGMSPMIRHWIRNTVFRDFVHNFSQLSNPSEQISGYVVFRDVAASPDSPPAPEIAISEHPLVELKNQLVSDTSPMCAETLLEKHSNEDETEVEVAIADVTMAEVILDAASPSTVLTANSSTLSVAAEEFPDVVIGSENWHSAVPRDWVPIITRDVHRQRRQAPQSPFSDAYIDGMPSKRRKVMSNGTSSASLMGPVSNILSESLQQAIATSGVQPQTSIEQIKKEVSQDTALQAAYKDQVKCAIQERLRNDMDYSPERFPNAEQYFNKGSQ